MAAIRPDAWNLPLLLHVAGAMLLVAALVVALLAAGAALRRDEGTDGLARVAFRALVVGVLPSYLAMRVGAEWVRSEEGVGDEAAWVGIGYATSDAGLLVAIIATLLAWRASRRGPHGGRGLTGGVAALSGVLLVAYAVTIWAMTAKPA